MDERNSVQELNEQLQKLESDIATLAKLSEGNPQGEKREINLLGTVQSLLSLLVGFTALLTASGFLIVNVYLARYTDIHGYSFNPAQYITASVGLAFYIISIVVIFGAIVDTLVSGVLIFAQKRLGLGLKRDLSSKSMSFAHNILNTAKMIPVIVSKVPVFSIVWLLFTSIVYGLTFYGIVPRYLGGGAPVGVYVILRDTNAVDEFGFDSIPLYPNVVGMALLAELTDGILVYNNDHNYAAVIKNDQIIGVIDPTAGEWMLRRRLIGTPAFLSTEMPTPEVTSDETLTPQVVP